MRHKHNPEMVIVRTFEKDSSEAGISVLNADEPLLRCIAIKLP
jgi:hypothetical protein